MLKKLEHCQPCPLYGSGYGFSNITGHGGIPLMAVAEASGADEEEQGRPLVEWAPSGSLFERVCEELGVGRHELSVTNILRCRPPHNDLFGMPYERSAIDRCAYYLDGAVQRRQPRCILALGAIPFRELTPEDFWLSSTEARGFIVQSRFPGIPVIGTFHPAHLRRGAMHLYGVMKRDIQLALTVARQGVPARKERDYLLSPTREQVEQFIASVLAAPASPLAYDIETAGIYGEKEPADWAAKRIVQIQFSFRAGHALVLPFTQEWMWAIAALLSSPNPKWDYNGRCADRIALRAAGLELNGELHDLINAYGHVYPHFWGGKDDKHGEKGVVSRMMGLQSCTSFYAPEEQPWKHLSAMPGQVPYYGAVDADMTYRCGEGLFADLQRLGLMSGYLAHKHETCKALDVISLQGLPVDSTAQAELRAYTVEELGRLARALQTEVPACLRPLHPPAGYKVLPKAVKAALAGSGVGSWVSLADPAKPPTKTKPKEGELVVVGERYALRLPFNPCSPGEKGHVGQYILHKGYPMPTKIDDPTKGTTGKDELEKLAKQVGDPVLDLIVGYRKLRKTGMDYTAGKWAPAADGCVHPTFRPNTASQQTTASDPNTQQFPEHSGLAKRAKQMVAATTGRTLVKIDMRGFHSRMIGFLAGDRAYYDLADEDVHSFVTAHFLHLPDADYLLEMDKAERLAVLAAIKRKHTHTRNYKVKRTVHGAQFGLGPRKLYRMYTDDFTGGEREAVALRELLRQLFPITFGKFPKWVREQITVITPTRLLNEVYGHHRLFYDFDAEQATAYLPSNSAHCEIQSALVRLHVSGALQRYGACNFVHDSIWFHCPDELVAECVAVVQRELEAPSTVLFNRWGPFQCNADVEVGQTLATMKGYSV